MCRKFIFGTDVSATPISKHAPTDTELTLPSSSDRCMNTHGELEDVSNQDSDDVVEERSVD